MALVAVAKFVGKAGNYLNGIPARHLTADDWAGLTREQRAAVRASRLYEVAPAYKRADPAPPVSAPAPEPEPEPVDDDVVFDETPPPAEEPEPALVTENAPAAGQEG